MKSRKIIYLFILFLLFSVLRIIYLDSDFPIIHAIKMADIDEFYYSIGGFNLYHYGALKNNVIPFADGDVGPFTALLDGFTFISLKLFGNNFYGLRMASVLASCLVFILLLLI